MSFQSGQKLLHYRLAEKIGEGGMGEVWKAVDTSLDREVALKFLPAAFVADAERRARFEREAKLLASFNHPHIAGVFGLHESEGHRFLAMELVPGRDLSWILRQGPMSPEDAVVVGLQVAEALELAHEHGVIHRDLKPGNVCWTPDRQTKVLDFGLAKALEVDDASQDLHDSPTVTAAQTRDGVLLGTAAYMSPEQARGQSVDRRADIWAFGCVLFEVLSGERAFDGETVSDTIVSVLSHDPDWSRLPMSTPPRLRRLLERCLTKDPRQRLRDVGEARIVLESMARGDGEGEPVTAPADRPRRWWRAGGAVVLAAATFGAGWILGASVGEDSPTGIDPDVRLRRLTYAEGLQHEPTLSADGNYVAYTTDDAGNLDIAVLPLGGGTVRRVVGHPSDDAHPSWSPDGTRLAFVSARDRAGMLTAVGGLGTLSRRVSGNGGDIFLVPALGGAVTKLVDNGLYPDWSPDASEVVFQSNRDGRWDIWRVSAEGGEPRRLTEDSEIDYQPVWSPDGAWIVFGSIGPDGLCAVPVEGGSRTLLFGEAVVAPSFSPDGEWVYFSSDRASSVGSTNLWRIPFRPGEPPVRRPQRVTAGEGSELGATVSSDGSRLVYGEIEDAPDIWAWNSDTGEVQNVTSLEGSEDFPHLSPDGTELVFLSDRGSAEGIWRLDLPDRSLVHLEGTESANSPRWSPDGERLVYSLVLPAPMAEDSTVLVVRRWGDVKGEVVARDGLTGAQWSPDGTRIAGSNPGIWVHDLEGGSEQIVEGDDSGFPTWSPDGAQIAYQKEIRGGVREIWVIGADGEDPRLLAGGDVEYSHPQWNPVDPDLILVVVDHLDLGLVRVSTGEMERITDLASSRVLVDYPSWSFDGRRAFFSLSRMTGDLFAMEGL